MEYDNIPLLFTCTSNTDRYLCLCNCINNGFRWIAAKCSTDTLKDLVEQRTSIRNAFKASQSLYYLIIIEKNNGEISYSQENYETLEADNEFPEPALMLDDDFVDEDIKDQIINLAETRQYHVSSHPGMSECDLVLSSEYEALYRKKPMQLRAKESFSYSNTDEKIKPQQVDEFTHQGHGLNIQVIKKEVKSSEHSTTITCSNSMLNELAA